jgi:hypothetical protein
MNSSSARMKSQKHGHKASPNHSRNNSQQISNGKALVRNSISAGMNQIPAFNTTSNDADLPQSNSDVNIDGNMVFSEKKVDDEGSTVANLIPQS